MHFKLNMFQSFIKLLGKFANKSVNLEKLF